MNSPEPPTRLRHAVVAWLTAAAVLGYLCRNCIGVAEETIREDVGLTLEQSGWFMGAFFWTYAVLQVPAGIVGREWGTRRTLVFCAIAWSGAIALIAVAPWANPVVPAFGVLIAGQLVMGAAQAGLFPAAVQSVRHWIPEPSRARSSACLAAGMQIGAIVAALLTAFLIARVRWQFVFLAYAIPGVLWAAMFHRSFFDRPEEHPGVNDAERALIRARGGEVDESTRERQLDDDRVHNPWGAILSSPSVWLVCCQQMFRGAGYAFFATWLPTFLKQSRGVSTLESGVSQGIVFSATLAGSLFAGTLMDAVLRRTGSLRWSRGGVGTASMAACAGLILSAYYVEDATGAVALIAGGAFMAACAGPAAYVVTIDLGGRSVPQVFGLMNMSGNLAAATTPIVLGRMFSGSQDWNRVLFLFAGMYGAAALCWLFVDPAACVDPEEEAAT